ncbi:hypothetical protein CHS0354_009263 [Potamilus streckersoni]|uniref:Uncharacterized protein n=1 Tax=Potamilus streckersoni TaxID=2493646 RepID=A0AAE0SXR9_9BIVA|nr:hypothetical protein CHS0354_009263 [Potamilus streckersoni]
MDPQRAKNGNINIEDTSYDLQPAETIDSYGHLTHIPDLIGKRYHLLEQENIQLETSADNKDTANVVTSNVAEDKENHYNSEYSTLSSRIIAKLRDRDETETLPSFQMISTDKTRQLKQNYYVKVAVLIDSALWQL